MVAPMRQAAAQPCPRTSQLRYDWRAVFRITALMSEIASWTVLIRLRNRCGDKEDVKSLAVKIGDATRSLNQLWETTVHTLDIVEAVKETRGGGQPAAAT